MTRTISFIIVLFLWTTTSFGQEPIDVTDQTIKINGLKEEELHFGFAAGDKIVFNFKEAGNNELKEIEIIEYPNNSKFSDYKAKQVENKTISVTKQGVYIFRFKNSALGGRICKIKIQRIPASKETQNFNSTVTWVDKQETTYNTYIQDVIVGYDSTYVQQTKKVLVKTEQREVQILDKTQTVNSLMNDNGNRSWFDFVLPQNKINETETEKVISWAYWVGVGQEASQKWQQNITSLTNTVAPLAATFVGIPSPLAKLATGAISSLFVPSTGEDVYYSIANERNYINFRAGNSTSALYDKGKGVAGYRAFTNDDMLQGTYYVLLSNDNTITGISVNVKVSAVVEKNVYESQPYTETVVTPRYEKKTFSDPVIKTIRVPETGK